MTRSTKTTTLKTSLMMMTPWKTSLLWTKVQHKTKLRMSSMTTPRTTNLLWMKAQHKTKLKTNSKTTPQMTSLTTP